MDELWGDDEPDWFEKDDDDADKDDGGDTKEDGGSDYGGDEGTVPGGTQHVVILLDCDRSGMFEPTLPDPEFPDDRVSAVAYSLAALQAVVRNKIRTVTIQKTGKRDGFGVLLYNTRLRTPVERMEEEGEEEGEPKNEKGSGSDEDEEEEEEEESDDLLYGAAAGPKLTTVHVLVPLAPPGVATVKRLQSVRPDEFTGECELDLRQEYCKTAQEEDEEEKEGIHQREPPLLKALQEAMSCYSTAACVKKTKSRSSAKFEEADSKQIWILTANDNPVASDDAEAARVLIETANDVRENGIELHVWPVGSAAFDAAKFYNRIASSILAAESGVAAADATEWVRRLESHFKRTRPAYRVPLLLPNWKLRGKSKDSPSILLDFYNLQQPARAPAVVEIHQETGKLLGKIRQISTHEGGNVLVQQRSFEKQEKRGNGGQRLRTFTEFGSTPDPAFPMQKGRYVADLVALSTTDKVAIKKQCNANQEFASLILLGFKPDTAIPFYHSIEKSYFCYPSDAGSADAFAHLHRSMLKRNVIAVGELLTRVTATSRLVVLRPLQEEGGDEDEGRPPGLLVTAIPFDDEMRAIEPDVAARTWEETGNDLASEDLVEAAMSLVQKQTLVGVEIGQDFQNAYMCRFWNYVEHIALNEQLRVDNRYDTEIDKEMVLKQAGEQIDKFLALLPEDVKPEKAARKRKIEPDDSGVDWEQVYLDGALSKCKVADLKKKLKSLGELLTGNKPVLIERVSKHLELEYQAAAAVKKEED